MRPGAARRDTGRRCFPAHARCEHSGRGPSWPRGRDQVPARGTGTTRGHPAGGAGRPGPGRRADQLGNADSARTG